MAKFRYESPLFGKKKKGDINVKLMFRKCTSFGEDLSEWKFPSRWYKDSMSEIQIKYAEARELKFVEHEGCYHAYGLDSDVLSEMWSNHVLRRENSLLTDKLLKIPQFIRRLFR